ncbi:MAG: DUF2996 domain-containing protein [Synechococcaceae cyanobacterium]
MTDSAAPAPTPSTAASADPAAAKAPAATKAKPPAPEDTPFEQFLPQLLLPALSKEVQAYGGPAPQLEVLEGAMPVVGSPCWMVRGSLPGDRRFWLCFCDKDINGSKTVALAEGDGPPSLLESFLIDERKTSLALLVSRLVQRLNGQKWLGPN